MKKNIKIGLVVAMWLIIIFQAGFLLTAIASGGRDIPLIILIAPLIVILLAFIQFRIKI